MNNTAMILTNPKYASVTVDRVEYVFLNIEDEEVQGWKRLLQALYGAGYKFEVYSEPSQHFAGQYQNWCELPDIDITIYVMGKDAFSIDGDMCDWDVGNKKKLMKFLEEQYAPNMV